MNKLQVQLPTPLYKKIKLLAKNLDYSMAEILRKGAEQMVLYYPQHTEEGKKQWELPKAKALGLKVADPQKLRALANERG